MANPVSSDPLALPVHPFISSDAGSAVPVLPRHIATGCTTFIPAFTARLAVGMTDDLEAIMNAFRYPWSTGPVEGHITRVKLIKRAGYGRAKLPLRARILGPN